MTEPSTKDLMVDLETLSTGPRAVVVQIGLAMFDPLSEQTGKTLQLNVTAQSCLMHGGEICPETVDWWRAQEVQTRIAVMETSAISIQEALLQLEELWLSTEAQRIWSNGAGFDVVILEHYYRALGMEPPWRYSAVRDTRTVWWLAEQRGWRRENRAGHTALRDALEQVDDVQEAIRTLRAWDLGNKPGWLLDHEDKPVGG